MVRFTAVVSLFAAGAAAADPTLPKGFNAYLKKSGAQSASDKAKPQSSIPDNFGTKVASKGLTKGSKKLIGQSATPQNHDQYMDQYAGKYAGSYSKFMKGAGSGGQGGSYSSSYSQYMNQGGQGGQGSYGQYMKQYSQGGQGGQGSYGQYMKQFSSGSYSKYAGGATGGANNDYMPKLKFSGDKSEMMNFYRDHFAGEPYSSNSSATAFGSEQGDFFKNQYASKFADKCKQGGDYLAKHKEECKCNDQTYLKIHKNLCNSVLSAAYAKEYTSGPYAKEIIKAQKENEKNTAEKDASQATTDDDKEKTVMDRAKVTAEAEKAALRAEKAEKAEKSPDSSPFVKTALIADTPWNEGTDGPMVTMMAAMLLGTFVGVGAQRVLCRSGTEDHSSEGYLQIV